MGAAERVRGIDQAHPVGAGLERSRVVADRRRDRIRPDRPAVIRLTHRHDRRAPGGGRRESQGEIDRFAAAVHEEHGVERVRREVRESSAEVGDRRVVEPRVRVQQRPLAGDGIHESRVCVPGGRDVVHHVEVGLRRRCRRSARASRARCAEARRSSAPAPARSSHPVRRAAQRQSLQRWLKRGTTGCGRAGSTGRGTRASTPRPAAGAHELRWAVSVGARELHPERLSMRRERAQWRILR